MSVIFGTALTDEEKKILDWAKERMKDNPQGDTVAAVPVDESDIVKRVTVLEAKSTKNNKTGFSTSESLKEFKEKTGEQNTFRLNEIKGLRKSLETLEGKVNEHDVSIKTHRKELTVLNLKFI